MSKRKTSKKNRPPAEPPTTAWQSPFALLGFAVLAAFAIIGIVVFLTPSDGPADISDLERSHSIEADSPANYPNAPQATWPPLPTTPAVATLDTLEQEMLIEAKRLEVTHPKNAKALDLCASVYYDLNELEDADRLWKLCLATQPTAADSYLSYATFLTRTQRAEEAIAILEQAHNRSIETAGTYLQLAKAQEASGNLEKASELAQEVTRRFPEFAESWFLSGRVLNQAGKHSEAEACMRRALSLNYPETEVLPILVTVLARQGKRQEATELRAQLKSLNERNSPERDSAGSESPNDVSDSQEIVPFQEKFEASLRNRAARMYLLAAVLEREAWNSDEMFRAAVRCVELKPDDASGLVFLAEQYVAQNRFGEAIEAYKRLIEVQPENLVHFTNLAGLAFREQNLALAESALTKGVEAHPGEPVLKISLAKTYISQEKPLEARELMIKLVESTQHPEAFMVLGASYQMTGNIQEAEAAFEKARRIAPNARLPR